MNAAMNTQARSDAMFASPVQVRGAGMRFRTPGAPARLNTRTTAVSPTTPLPHLRLSFLESAEYEPAVATVAPQSSVPRSALHTPSTPPTPLARFSAARAAPAPVVQDNEDDSDDDGMENPQIPRIVRLYNARVTRRLDF